jgi:two-component system sensor histidine kinase SenX3
LENGLKFSPPHGRVRLRVERRLGWIELTVTDEGIGIPRAEIPHVFERFYRGAAARSGSGSGLGLAIVREIVSDHGGDVCVHSMEGVGSTFTLRLPLAMSPIPAPPDGLARTRK